MLTALFLLAVLIGAIREMKPIRVFVTGERIRKSHGKRASLIGVDKIKP